MTEFIGLGQNLPTGHFIHLAMGQIHQNWYECVKLNTYHNTEFETSHLIGFFFVFVKLYYSSFQAICLSPALV